MSFIDEFQANIEALPNHLRRKYALLRDLDKSLQGVQRQNEQRCEKEIEDMIQRIKAGNVTPDSSLIKFSDDALDEQKHAIRIADEKVALASQAYDLVDAHIQQLDQYLKKFDEELRRERDVAVVTGTPATTVENNGKSGRSGEEHVLLQQRQLQPLQQQQQHQVEWIWIYLLIQMNQHIVSAIKLAMVKWLRATILIAK
ncbi:PHD finger protein ING1 isoform X2 [Nicotiana sylvestris]|uniref:PHD finger protein ING1 isoform X2 n=2 Tax=Nicotiana TaxID=4085 RepID=A0A1S3XK82_TOBAC|nr:PREDICTED: PHD finger protein ING1 isoform X2 [Nicotiana sylvestris]XP_016440328.1 PREDICTED: PHD finger protein ING1 isoform X2 [Nicotiana tabacum]